MKEAETFITEVESPTKLMEIPSLATRIGQRGERKAA